MTTRRRSPTPDLDQSSWHLALLILLFMGSGCSALIYEIVWFQLLELIIGSSAISMGVLLGTFMGGMCLGSLVSPKIISARRHPIRVYALLELGIGLFGILVLWGMPYAGGLYTAIGGSGFSGLLLRGALCGVCLLAPTFLMGATLPSAARWMSMTPAGVSWLGLFYGGNIAGAVFGSLLTGFYLLRVYDMGTATYVAASINAAIALAGLWLAGNTRSGSAREPAGELRIEYAQGRWSIYLAIALSGLCALGAEVVWTRLLSLMLGATVYTFSIILAVFLSGLGIGSAAGSVLSRWSRNPRRDLGLCQLLLTAAIAWAAYMLTRSLPYWPIYPPLSKSLWISFQLDLVRCSLAILPAACLWGASFPLALAGVASARRDPGKLVGGLYSANTAGAIVGALGFSLAAIRIMGTQHAQQALILTSMIAGLVALIPAVRSSVRSHFVGAMAVLLAVGLGATFTLSVSPVPGPLVAYGRLMALRLGLVDSKTKAGVEPNILYVGEGLNTSIAVSENENHVRNFHVAGKIEASSAPKDMQLQRMLGNIPALYHPQPRSVLIVGFGAGVTAGSFVLYPSVERIVICEIEPLIPQVVSQYFRQENHNVLQDPRVEVIYDDARHYILTTHEKFDIITSDPIHPWVKGSAALYTSEYFDLVRRHLNPGGVVTQWVPLYESGEATVKSEMATFFQIFPNATLWSTNLSDLGQDLVLLGVNGVPRVNVDDLNLRLYRADHLAVARSLQEAGFRSGLELFGTYLGQAPDLLAWASGAEINRDRNLRLQYLAGMELNDVQDSSIYEHLLNYRRFPDELFVGSEALKSELRYAMSRRPKRP